MQFGNSEVQLYRIACLTLLVRVVGDDSLQREAMLSRLSAIGNGHFDLDNLGVF